jgi:hypothetical protein
MGEYDKGKDLPMESVTVKISYGEEARGVMQTRLQSFKFPAGRGVCTRLC